MDYTWIFEKDKAIMWLMYNHVKQMIIDNDGCITINGNNFTEKDLFRIFVNSGLWELMH